MQLKWNTTKQENPLRDTGGSPEGEITDPNDFVEHSSLVVAAKEGANALNSKYPGWLWAIQINAKGRVFHLFNHALHDQWGYLLHADDLEHGNARKAFIKAGGEILERFGLPRAGMNPQRLAAVPRDLRGRAIPIIDDLRHAAARKEMQKRKLIKAIEQGHVIQGADGSVLVGVN